MTPSPSQTCFSLQLRPAPLLGQFVVSSLTYHPRSENWHLTIPRILFLSNETFNYLFSLRKFLKKIINRKSHIYLFNPSLYTLYSMFPYICFTVTVNLQRKEVTAGLAFSLKFILAVLSIRSLLQFSNMSHCQMVLKNVNI